VLAKLARRTPWRLSLQGKVEARFRYGLLEVAAPAAETAPPPPIALPGPGLYPLPGRAQTLSLEVETPELVPWPLVLRTRRPGDRFRPEGGSGGKKLKSWLIDRKIPRERRDALLVVAAGPEVLALPELGARAQEAGPNGAGLMARVVPEA
jgi:tRNA(Ile)-lysidine synthase